MTETNMKKHTITVGSATLGESVRFTAEDLGTTSVNGGAEGGGLDLTFYRLPDQTYRVLIVGETGTSMLQPSNLSDVLGTGEPAEYGRYSLEDIQAHDLYAPAFAALMDIHARNHAVRDLD